MEDVYPFQGGGSMTGGLREQHRFSFEENLLICQPKRTAYRGLTTISLLRKKTGISPMHMTFGKYPGIWKNYRFHAAKD
jgi:hypothetical protein